MIPDPPRAVSPHPLPSGTVTFVFTDIEGSTERWDRDREAMQDAVRRHDTLMHEAIREHGGYVFKTIGDAFCAAFSRPEDALASALAAQRSLAAQDFSRVDGVRVRMAIHTGTADERDGDYFGPTVNRVARLLAIGYGGQVLVSTTTADLLQGAIPPGSSLQDLGAHRLKDLARAERVYQVVAPGLPDAFPPPRSLEALPSNLPVQLTSFIGRDAEVAEIKALVQEHRLVTLVGTGGAGKSRCAQQVGAEMLDGVGDGVWLIEFAPISDPGMLSRVIAAALDVQETPHRPLLDTLLSYLKRKRSLLILDNCEHVIEEARNVTAAILRSCSDVHILATSREGLNVAGERVYRMPSLSLPPRDKALRAEAAREYGAVLLFADRALAAGGSFALTDENAPYVADICRRLDGIPLAIELAAARVKILSPQQLLQRLDERFRVLTGGDRTAEPRQQTMRALIDWSYDLLSDDERKLFRKLSIFAGGFTLEGAGAVGAEDTVDDLAVMDLLSSLVDKSLVQAEPAGSGTRYRLLESTRQYAHEKLVEHGELEATARAHAAAYLALAEEVDRSWETAPDRAWRDVVEAELDNWRAALEWALKRRADVLTGQRITGALIRAASTSAMVEGRNWLQIAMQTVDMTTPPPVVAKLRLMESYVSVGYGEFDAAHNAAVQALEHYHQCESPAGIAWAQEAAGLALTLLDRHSEAEGHLSDALSAVRTLKSRKLHCDVLLDLAILQMHRDDVAKSRAYFAEALTIAKASGFEREAGIVTLNFAEMEFRGGDVGAALRLAAEALGGGGVRNPLVLSNMAMYLIALKEFDEARDRAREAITLWRDLQHPRNIAYTLQHLATAEALRANQGNGLGESDLASAARLLGYVDAVLTDLGMRREPNEAQEYDAILSSLRHALGDEQVARLMDEGRAWTEDQAVGSLAEAIDDGSR